MSQKYSYFLYIYQNTCIFLDKHVQESQRHKLYIGFLAFKFLYTILSLIQSNNKKLSSKA